MLRPDIHSSHLTHWRTVKFIIYLEFTNGGEESSTIGLEPAILLTKTKLHCEEVALEQNRLQLLNHSTHTV